MRLATFAVVAPALGLAGCAMLEPVPPPPRYPPYGGPAMVISVAEKAPFGPYLVGPDGRALYILEGTRSRSGRNRCDGQCLAVWPPLRALAPPRAGPGVDPRRLRTVAGYGGPQVAYARWPLYYYHRDRGPGDTTGQHVTDAWGTWHLLTPTGLAIRPLPR